MVVRLIYFPRGQVWSRVLSLERQRSNIEGISVRAYAAELNFRGAAFWRKTDAYKFLARVNTSMAGCKSVGLMHKCIAHIGRRWYRASLGRQRPVIATGGAENRYHQTQPFQNYLKIPTYFFISNCTSGFFVQMESVPGDRCIHYLISIFGTARVKASSAGVQQATDIVDKQTF